ncbi:MAG: hypothetical protein J0H82_04630 [Alphaproteobacteria bacterium]|jgi:hypothetical protein|nr:hypothetical protein [Alphaproteobacteria bacterium]
MALTAYILKGHAAATFGSRFGYFVNSYADPASGARDDIDPDTSEAAELLAADPSQMWVAVPAGLKVYAHDADGVDTGIIQDVDEPQPPGHHMVFVAWSGGTGNWTPADILFPEG